MKSQGNAAGPEADSYFQQGERIWGKNGWSLTICLIRGTETHSSKGELPISAPHSRLADGMFYVLEVSQTQDPAPCSLNQLSLMLRPSHPHQAADSLLISQLQAKCLLGSPLHNYPQGEGSYPLILLTIFFLKYQMRIIPNNFLNTL